MNIEFNKVNYIFDILFEGVLLVDKNHVIKYSNASAQRLFGYDKDELLDSSLDVLLPMRFRAVHSKKVKEFMEGGKPTLMGNRPLLQAVTKNGEEIPISISICSAEFDGQKYSVAIIRDASNLHTEISSITALIETDHLTKLGNRLAFSNRVQSEISMGNQKFSIFFIDLADFKKFNDKYGHDVGDKVLEVLALRLRQSIRDEDLAARIGGDEFVLLIDDLVDTEALIAKAKKIAETVSSPVMIKGNDFRIRINIGFACYPEDGKTEQELLRMSDQSMYMAKKNNLVIFTQDALRGSQSG